MELSRPILHATPGLGLGQKRQVCGSMRRGGTTARGSPYLMIMNDEEKNGTLRQRRAGADGRTQRQHAHQGGWGRHRDCIAA